MKTMKLAVKLPETGEANIAKAASSFPEFKEGQRLGSQDARNDIVASIQFAPLGDDELTHPRNAFVNVPSNYKDPKKIASKQAELEAKLLEDPMSTMFLVKPTYIATAVVPVLSDEIDGDVTIWWDRHSEDKPEGELQALLRFAGFLSKRTDNESDVFMFDARRRLRGLGAYLLAKHLVLLPAECWRGSITHHIWDPREMFLAPTYTSDRERSIFDGHVVGSEIQNFCPGNDENAAHFELLYAAKLIA